MAIDAIGCSPEDSDFVRTVASAAADIVVAEMQETLAADEVRTRHVAKRAAEVALLLLLHADDLAIEQHMPEKDGDEEFTETVRLLADLAVHPQNADIYETLSNAGNRES